VRALLILVVFLASFVTGADEIRPALIQIQQVGASHYDILWKVPARAGMKLKLDLILDDQRPPPNRIARFISGTYVESWSIERPQGIQGLNVSVDNIASTFTDVIIRYQGSDGELLTGRINATSRQYTFAMEPSFESVITTYTGLGIEHILLGTDHLLFVACLVIIAGFTRKLVWAITGFTLAHSITLALSTLDFVALPIAPIEAVIALSIVFLALEIAKKHQSSLTYRYPVVVSSSFGLLHGFGFAAVLAEIGLPKSDLVTALLFFNVGVEMGQLIFIACVLTALSIINSIKNLPLRPMEVTSSYVIGSVAMMWCIERVLVFI
jgi:hydrogenase/urease accessory protein HupE